VGIVPIVEPEVLMDGDHTIGRCRIVTEQTLKVVFEALATHGVHLPGIILKPNMVISGSDCPEQAGPDEVARQTIEVLSALVPAEVPGIAFLSGGQTEEQATLHLQAMNALDGIKKPWRLTFSYGRALQAAALKSWSGQAAQLAAGQQAFMHRARMNGAAAEGTYAVEMEAAA
jgi:fructose-bisphosphate aldolase class I